jgi:3-hydroxyethyl bacteriochlorophyllide a dehydrogenase
MNTRAVVIPEPGRVEMQNVTLRTPGSDDVIVTTAYTSISAGTERMLLAGQMPHPMLQLPVIPGYETVGRVSAIGDNVDSVAVDDWVYVGGAHCYEGINPAWGGQSATVWTSAERVVPLRDMEPRQGVLLALTATALHGIDVLDAKVGDRVLVIGQGPVGQLAARLVKKRGTWVSVSDKNPSRLKKAIADKVINVDETDLNEAVGDPVNVIIEASGSMDALVAALPILANGGTILLLGYYQNLQLPYMPLFLKEARLLTAKEWQPGDLARSRDLIASGKLEVASLLTHEVPVTDVARAYDVALNDIDCLKLLVDWSEGSAS